MGNFADTGKMQFHPHVDDPRAFRRPRRSRGLLGLGLGVAGLLFAASQLSVLTYIGILVFGSGGDPAVPIEEPAPLAANDVTEPSPAVPGHYTSAVEINGGRAPASASESDPELQAKSELAKGILAKGNAYFEESGNQLQGREEILNVARSLSMDPSRKYSGEITELTRLVLQQPLEPTGEVSSLDLSRAHASSEWALSLFLDQNQNTQEAVRTAIELISSQEQPSARERLRLVFLQKKPEFEIDLNRALGN